MLTARPQMDLPDAATHALTAGGTAAAVATVMTAMAKYGVIFSKDKDKAALDATTQMVQGFVDLVKLQQGQISVLNEAIRDGEKRHAQCLLENADLRLELRRNSEHLRQNTERIAAVETKIANGNN